MSKYEEDTTLPRVAIDYGVAPAPLLPGAWRWVPTEHTRITITTAAGEHWRYTLPRDRAHLQDDLQGNIWALPAHLLTFLHQRSGAGDRDSMGHDGYCALWQSAQDACTCGGIPEH
jgi:hypothetical protein